MTKPPAMPELPEPELGYIETDKSKQPAFSARQMRVALQSAQPAEVSDEELLTAYNSIDPCNESPTDRLIRRLRAILTLRPQAVPMTLPPVEGDVLPAIGSKVLIHLASSDSWAEHEVVGYYVWEAINELAKPRHHRVFVRVRDTDGILNARHICDLRGITAQGAQGEQ